MKQRITVEQLQELSQDQRSRLEQWCSTRGYSIALSIGQMIEILHERNWFYELSFTKEIEDSPHEDTWHVYTTSVGSYKVKEPCDGLWEAVKEVL